MKHQVSAMALAATRQGTGPGSVDQGGKTDNLFASLCRQLLGA